MQLPAHTENKCMMAPKYLRGNLDKYVVFCPFTSNRIVSKETGIHDYTNVNHFKCSFLFPFILRKKLSNFYPQQRLEIGFELCG